LSTEHIQDTGHKLW